MYNSSKRCLVIYEDYAARLSATQ